MPRVFPLAQCGLIGATLLLGGCVSDQPAPVEDRSIRSEFAENDTKNPPPVTVKPQQNGSMYRVQTGDTLYAIAFTHGVDFRDLAAWNRIPAPYRIFVGQELVLSAPVSMAITQPAPGNAVTTPLQDRPVTAAHAPLPLSPPPRATNSPPPPKEATSSPMFENVEPNVTPAPTPPPEAAQLTPPPKIAPPVPSRPPIVAEATPPPKPIEPAPQLNAGGVGWHWPAAGNVIGTYVSGDQIKQGIDIAGNEGDPITATADGEVVYSGNGLIGYGELIIIKHNASFLSAYGHNRKRLVQEGDKVKAGQRIAEMGASAAARNELHFEIRKNGKPVNPLEYLPVR